MVWTMEQSIRKQYADLRGMGKGHEDALIDMIGPYGSRNVIERALRMTRFQARYGYNGGELVSILLGILAVVLGFITLFGR